MAKVLNDIIIGALMHEFSDIVVKYRVLNSPDKKDEPFKVKIWIKDGSTVAAFERLDAKGIKYSYHWMTPKNTIIIRWDKADNHPEVPTSPYHIHIEGIAEPQPSEPMTLQKVLAYIAGLLGVFLCVMWLVLRN